MTTNITLAQIRIFQAVAESLSYTRAAEALGYSESAVYQQVRSFERLLQVKLFSTHKHRLQLTALGSQLIELAHDVTARVEELEALAAKFHQSSASQVVIAAGGVTGSYLFRHVLADLDADQSGQIKLVTRPSHTIVPGLDKDLFQIGIIPSTPGLPDSVPDLTPAMVATPWLRDKWLIARSPGRTTSKRRSASQPRRIYYVATHFSSYPALVALLSSAPFGGPVECVALETVEAAKSAAIGGLAEAFLPGMSVAEELRLGMLEEAPFPSIPRQLYIIRKSSAPAMVQSLCQSLSAWQARHAEVVNLAPAP